MEVQAKSIGSHRRKMRGFAARAIFGTVGIGIVIYVAQLPSAQVPEFGRWILELDGYGPVVFVLGYALATVLFIPGSALTLLGGALYGLTHGIALVFFAATLGSCLAFLVARYCARGAVKRKLESDPRFSAIDKAIRVDGLRIAFLLRLSPLVPFNLLNYSLGLTQIRFLHYVLAGIGMLPGTMLYVYYGKMASDLAAFATFTKPERGPLEYAVLLVGLVATVYACRRVSRLARDAFNQATSGF